jgi:hypothetical protein
MRVVRAAALSWKNSNVHDRVAAELTALAGWLPATIACPVCFAQDSFQEASSPYRSWVPQLFTLRNISRTRNGANVTNKAPTAICCDPSHAKHVSNFRLAVYV